MLKNNLLNFFYQKIKQQLKKYQFQTFLLGIKNNNLNENQKKKIKIELGRLLEKTLEKKVDFKNPDILIEIDTENKKINLKIKSLYIFGYYEKIKAGIPQTFWHKKRYQTSVQEEIGNIILSYTQGDSHSFHGCGREDIDVKTIGSGRPFVIEIKNPKIRNIDLKKIEDEINKKSTYVKVHNLEFSNKEKINEIKKATPDKTYQAKVLLEKEVDKKTLIAACQKLTNITINQQTPTRVLRRRANLLRKRKVYYFKLLKYHPLIPIFEIKTQSGTYIKELVSGDNQRTRPSLSEILSQKTIVTELIVVKIDY
ncbi:MAG: hypothetical protein KatS3mg092_0553 [Patescibacteria group bacterium]|nr:MAG: hypothetical protein KatS3mg092_0553 [Patescibacteria group bacterium]